MPWLMQPNDAAKGISSLHRKVLKLMGNRFEISIVSHDEAWANECIQDAVEEIRRIEKLLTTSTNPARLIL